MFLTNNPQSFYTGHFGFVSMVPEDHLASVKECPDCASENIVHSTTRDQIICRDCGLVFEPLAPMAKRKPLKVAVARPAKKAKARKVKSRKKAKKAKPKKKAKAKKAKKSAKKGKKSGKKRKFKFW